jgi:hypothetical protein
LLIITPILWLELIIAALGTLIKYTLGMIGMPEGGLICVVKNWVLSVVNQTVFLHECGFNSGIVGARSPVN